MFGDVFKDKDCFVTGHTGFKGAWLTSWLLHLGGRVHGYALAPEPHETLYDSLRLASRVTTDIRSDIRSKEAIASAIDTSNADFVFHLAAQPLVRKSFDIPLETFEVNTLGTANLLECIRQRNKPCIVICVTTDKCYENKEWLHSYRENDPMGGFDPYSASKGCAELVISSYRNSFFLNQSRVRLASARAGNVIGGGDWAIDRIVPDIFRALFGNYPIKVRNRHATRPWQHVLEPISGYLWLAACLHSYAPSSIHGPTDRHNDPLHGERAISSSQPFSQWPLADLQSGFNFGPSLKSNRPVESIVKEVLTHIPGDWQDVSDPGAPHEASKLNLAIDKAYHILGWQPVWEFEETIKKTTEWYYRVNQGEDALKVTMEQVSNYMDQATAMQLAWSR